jgi:hypothetical protein
MKGRRKKGKKREVGRRNDKIIYVYFLVLAYTICIYKKKKYKITIVDSTLQLIIFSNNTPPLWISLVVNTSTNFSSIFIYRI